MSIKTASNIEISRRAYASNLRVIKNIVGEGVKFSSVVKGNAYGHGLEVFVPMAESCGVNHFSVFNAEEAYIVQQNITHPETRIMIMGYVDDEDLSWAIEHEIEFFVFESERLMKAIKVAKKLQKKAKIHIEIETGLNRTGFSFKEIKAIAPVINSNLDHLIIEGICTHFAGAETIANHYRVTKQIQKFNKITKWLDSHSIRPNLYHTACSAASVVYPKSRMDMVRIGIMQYGFWPSRETFAYYIKSKRNREDPLHRLIAWKSKVMSIKQVKEAEFIGYGTSYLTGSEQTIAIVPIGYANGYGRALSNQGKVIIRGKRFGVVGMVNMNLLIVDITGNPEIEKGDLVTIIGSEGDATISVASFGELSDQLNYELLTRLPLNIPRQVVND